MDAFLGRAAEVEALTGFFPLTKSAMAVVYGRRRVGKTRLVEEAFKGQRLLKFEGLEKQPVRTQKRAFCADLARYFNDPDLQYLAHASWREIFRACSKQLGSSPAILFLDEFQWLAANRSQLVSDLKYAWDNFFQKNNLVYLVICGSVSSFIVRKVLRSKALYGRVALELNLQPLGLDVFLGKFGAKRQLGDIFDFYCLAGGIPEYWSYFDENVSARLNIERLAFNRSAYFVEEFHRIFISHFGSNKHYSDIVKALSERSLLRNDLIKRCKLSAGGTASVLLEDLELAGFIKKAHPFDKSSGSALLRYSLNDPFLRFYFKFILPNIDRIKASTEKLPFTALASEQAINIWRGLTFERFCLNQTEKIAKLLGFSAIRYKAGPYFNRKEQGVQIDLAYLRADRTLVVCEIKYHAQPLGRSIIAEVQEKIARLKDFVGYSIEKVLITNEVPQQSLLSEGYFNSVLLFKDLVA